MDGEDITILAEEYGSGSCPCPSDMDGDGDVDEMDLLFFGEDYGRIDCD